MAGDDWLATVDSYLYSVARIGAEETLAAGCVSERVPTALAGYVSIESELVHRATENDGGATEVHRGMMTVAGVRYRFEARLFIDSDGSHFVADVPKFAPMGWSTAAQAG